MDIARHYLSASILTNGKILVTGGYRGLSAELYDPLTGHWKTTGSMNSQRSNHRASLLKTENVLVIGGAHDSAVLNTAELYDPSTETWTSGGYMKNIRSFHTASLLISGEVLVTGGSDGSATLNSAELYNPFTGVSKGISDTSDV
jgi:large repetitive protein